MINDDIYIINLDHDKKRKEKILKQFSNYFNLNFIEGIIDKNSKKGCFLSHLKCIQIAKEKKLDYIIVLEDDCIIKNNDKNWYKRFQNTKEYLLENKNNWNLYLGAVNRCNQSNILEIIDYNNEKLLKINKGTCLHFVIYNKNCYDFFLNHEFNELPIDQIWFKKLSAIINYPFIFTQESEFSNIAKKYINYKLIFQNQENYLKKKLKLN